jgi:hypothetical protein
MGGDVTPDEQQTAPYETETELIETMHVRRDPPLAPLVDDIVDLLEAEGSVIDLSRHDRRGDVIELRVARPSGRSDS